MKTYNNLWKEFISVSNFAKAYKDARKGKGKQQSVKDFKNKKKIEYYRCSLASMKGWLIHAKTKNLIKQWDINKLELLLYTKK